ncbi:unnamed protein product [Prunus brigantina]
MLEPDTKRRGLAPYLLLVISFISYTTFINEETSMESVKKFLEKKGEMVESFVMKGIKVDLLEPVVLFAPSKYPLVY